MLLQPAQEVDTRIVDDVRNFLFGHPGAGGFDLTSLNIQRGRIMVWRATMIIENYGLGRATDFTDITAGDLELAALFSSVYGGDIDARLISGLVGWPNNTITVVWLVKPFGEFWRISLLACVMATGLRFLNAAEMEDLLMIDPVLFEQHAILTMILSNEIPVMPNAGDYVYVTSTGARPRNAGIASLGMIRLLLRLYVFDSRF